MIPGESLSAFPAAGSFVYPDSRMPEMTRRSLDTTPNGQCLLSAPRDWEMGGIDLSDPSAGSLYQVWQFRYSGGTIQVGTDPDGPWTDLITEAGVTEISGTFDTNMAPTVAYVASGVTKLWWFDSSIPGRATTTFAGCTSPRLTLDDKRVSQQANADILFFYLRAGALYYRQQRDRFATERLLCAEPPNTLRLGRVGMSNVNRVQIEFLTA